MRRMVLRVVWMMALLLLPASLLAQELAAIPSLRSPVVDVTGTLDAGQIQQLEQQALALQQRKGAQLQILIVPTTQPEAIEQYTQRVFDQWKIGRKGVDDGVLLLVAKDDRRVRIQPGYGLEGAIPDITANRIIQEYLAPRFREGDYAGGIAAATATLAGLIEGEALPAPVSGHAEGGNGAGGGGWIMALFIGLVVAMVRQAGSRGQTWQRLAGRVATVQDSHFPQQRPCHAFDLFPSSPMRQDALTHGRSIGARPARPASHAQGGDLVMAGIARGVAARIFVPPGGLSGGGAGTARSVARAVGTRAHRADCTAVDRAGCRTAELGH